MSRGQVAALGQRGVWVPLWILDELGAGTPAVFFAQLLFLTRGDLDAVVIRSDPEWTADTGLTSDQAFRARKKLEEVGWLACSIHQRDDGTPVPHIKVAWDQLDDRLREIAMSTSRDRGGPRRESAKSSSLPTDTENKTPCSPPKGDELVLLDASSIPTLPDPFDAFWKVYPLKAGKKAAQRAWSKAIKKETPEALIEHARAYAITRIGPAQQYIAHASTWLNGERWNDELPRIPKSEPRGMGAARRLAGIEPR